MWDRNDLHFKQMPSHLIDIIKWGNFNENDAVHLRECKTNPTISTRNMAVGHILRHFLTFWLHVAHMRIGSKTFVRNDKNILSWLECHLVRWTSGRHQAKGRRKCPDAVNTEQLKRATPLHQGAVDWREGTGLTVFLRQFHWFEFRHLWIRNQVTFKFWMRNYLCGQTFCQWKHSQTFQSLDLWTRLKYGTLPFHSVCVRCAWMYFVVWILARTHTHTSNIHTVRNTYDPQFRGNET